MTNATPQTATLNDIKRWLSDEAADNAPSGAFLPTWEVNKSNLEAVIAQHLPKGIEVTPSTDSVLDAIVQIINDNPQRGDFSYHQFIYSAWSDGSWSASVSPDNNDREYYWSGTAKERTTAALLLLMCIICYPDAQWGDTNDFSIPSSFRSEIAK